MQRSHQENLLKISKSEKYPHYTISGPTDSGLPFGMALAGDSDVDQTKLLEFIKTHLVPLMNLYHDSLSENSDYEKIAELVIQETERLRAVHAPTLKFGMTAFVVYEKIVNEKTIKNEEIIFKNEKKLFCSDFTIGLTNLEYPQKKLLHHHGILGLAPKSEKEIVNESKNPITTNNDDSIPQQLIYKPDVIEEIKNLDGDEEFNQERDKLISDIKKIETRLRLLRSDHPASEKRMIAQLNNLRKEGVKFGSESIDKIIGRVIIRNVEIKRDDSLFLHTSLPSQEENEETASVDHMKSCIRILTEEMQQQLQQQIQWDKMSEEDKLGKTLNDFSLQLKKHKNEAKELEKDIPQLNEEIDQLKENIKELEKNIKESKEKIKELGKNIKQSEEKIKELGGSIKQSEKRNNEVIESEVNKLDEENHEIENEVNKLDEGNDEVENEVKRLEKENHEVENEIKRLEKINNETIESKDRSIRAFELKKNNLEAKELRKNKCQQLKSKGKALYNDFNASNEEFTQRKTDLNVCYSVLANCYEQNITALTNYIEEAKDKITYSEKFVGIVLILDGVYHDALALLLAIGSFGCASNEELKKDAKSRYSLGLTIFQYGHLEPNDQNQDLHAYQPNQKLQHMDEFSEACRMKQ